MKTKYQSKRSMAGVSKERMAKLLGLSYVKYDSIEKGEVKMPINLIDKFNEIIKKGRFLNKLEENNDKKLIDEWFASMVEIKCGEPVIREKMREFNIPTYNALANLLGYTSASTIVNNINQNLVTPNVRARLYYFFNDEVNIQKPEKKVEEVVEQIDELYEVDEALEEVEEVITTVEEVIEEIDEEPIEEKEDLTAKIIKAYQEKIDNNFVIIEQYKSILARIELENKIYDEAIQIAKNQR